MPKLHRGPGQFSFPKGLGLTENGPSLGREIHSLQPSSAHDFHSFSVFFPWCPGMTQKHPKAPQSPQVAFWSATLQTTGCRRVRVSGIRHHLFAGMPVEVVVVCQQSSQQTKGLEPCLDSFVGFGLPALKLEVFVTKLKSHLSTQVADSIH